jgi:hypothetical protein
MQMTMTGTVYTRKRVSRPPVAAPPVAHDAPTQPSIRRPAPQAIMLARARTTFFTASPFERAALVGVVSIWVLVLLIAALAAGIVSYDLFFAKAGLTPDKQAVIDPRRYTMPLVSIGLEPLGIATPATQPHARPTARPPVIIVIPTPGK